MSRQNTKHPPRRSTSQQNSQRPWQEPASNKRQKKRIIQGEATRGPNRSGKRRVTRKRRTVRSPIPAMSSLVDSFREVTDPRVNRKRRHRLIDIIIIAVLAVMCNADTWKDIHIWGVANQQWR